MIALQSLLEGANGTKIGGADNKCLGMRKRWLQDMSIDINSTSKIQINRSPAELKFKHRVQVDTKFIQRRLVIHMANKATHFCAASLL